MNEINRRNIYPDGVYFVELKKLAQSSLSIKELLRKQFGEKFEQNMNEYFSGTKKLIIFDDFGSLISNNKIPYPTFLLRAIKFNMIHAIFVSQNKLNKIEEIEECYPWELKNLEPDESLVLLLLSKRKRIFGVETDISNLTKCDIIKKSGGDPSKLLDKSRLFIDRYLNQSNLPSKYSSPSKEITISQDDDEEFADEENRHPIFDSNTDVDENASNTDSSPSIGVVRKKSRRSSAHSVCRMQ